MAEWQKYRSHKIVQAAPIFQIVDAGGKLSALVKPYGDDVCENFVSDDLGMIAKASPGDYAIRYEDGYCSVSPKAVFEEGYTLVEP